MSERPRSATPVEMLTDLRDSVYPQIGSLASQHAEMHTGTELAPDFAVPSPEKTLATYASVCAQRGIEPAAGLDLGTLLARLTPDRQTAFRALNGMFPFATPLTAAEFAKLRGVQPVAVESTMFRATKQLREGAELRFSSNTNPRLTVSLETLARSILENKNGASSYDLELLKAMNGLPPYFVPLDARVIAEAEDVSRSTIALREKYAASRLLGDKLASRPSRTTASRSQNADMPDEKPAFETMEDDRMAHLLRLRDAGVYADLLCGLHAEDTREQTQKALLRNLEHTARNRQRLRQMHSNGHRPLAVLSANSAKPDTRRLVAHRVFSEQLDTATGREQLIAQLSGRAALLSEADSVSLDTIIAEGQEATQKIIDHNILLVFFTGYYLHHSLRQRGQLSRHEISGGYHGLHQAAERFDGSLGYSFSSYASKMIGGHMLRAWERDAAAQRGLKPATFRTARKVRRVESDLFQELQRAPTTAEIAERSNMTVERVERLTQAWHETQPRTLEDDVPVAQVAPRKAAKREKDDSDDPEVLAVIDQIASTAKLTPPQLHVLRSMFTGEGSQRQKTVAIAEQFHITTATVNYHRRAALAKLQTSPDALRLLRGFMDETDD